MLDAVAGWERCAAEHRIAPHEVTLMRNAFENETTALARRLLGR